MVAFKSGSWPDLGGGHAARWRSSAGAPGVAAGSMPAAAGDV